MLLYPAWRNVKKNRSKKNMLAQDFVCVCRYVQSHLLLFLVWSKYSEREKKKIDTIFIRVRASENKKKNTLKKIQKNNATCCVYIACGYLLEVIIKIEVEKVFFSYSGWSIIIIFRIITVVRTHMFYVTFFWWMEQ